MLLNQVVPLARQIAVFAVCVAAGLPTFAIAEENSSSVLQKLLVQERLQITALGSNKAKKIAGIGTDARIRVASLSKPKNKNAPAISSFTQLKEVPRASGGAEWACLSEALYFEARGESFRSIGAVAEVIVNRRNSSRYPGTICGVVSQGVGGRPGCQFSYKCDGRKEVFNEPAAYVRVGKMARLVLDGVLPKVTGGALFYHTKAVRPSWSRKFRRTAQIGAHYFYHPK